MLLHRRKCFQDVIVVKLIIIGFCFQRLDYKTARLIDHGRRNVFWASQGCQESCFCEIIIIIIIVFFITGECFGSRDFDCDVNVHKLALQNSHFLFFDTGFSSLLDRLSRHQQAVLQELISNPDIHAIVAKLKLRQNSIPPLSV
ncbi:hypothetical protein BC941DRAFT_167411 [Chlamydoabsidia padenii]|nr:hypothetical protein BC941DRAFT_167411 [Chlamydoabsidia padenii]